jgi:DNA-binding transcriptional regulator YdaS (Cro superfamily)
MDLDKYLSTPGSLTVTQLRERMQSLGYDVKSNAQIRQWQHKYAGRGPSEANCMGIELATNGAVTRRDLRQNDWHLIWPELADAGDRIKASDDTQPPVGASRRRRT